MTFFTHISAITHLLHKLSKLSTKSIQISVYTIYITDTIIKSNLVLIILKELSVLCTRFTAKILINALKSFVGLVLKCL